MLSGLFATEVCYTMKENNENKISLPRHVTILPT